jgi:hypothetical protein
MHEGNLFSVTFNDALCQSLPRVRFNKEGNLLSVTTAYSGLKVLANADGIKYLRENEPSKEPIDRKVCIFYCSPSTLNILLNLFSLCFYFFNIEELVM